MIVEVKDFFDVRLCNYLITYFHESNQKITWEPGVELIRLYQHMHSESIKKVHHVLVRHGIEYYGKSHFIENFEVVRRAPGNIMSLHKDYKPHDHTMIVYLNEDFTGGETHVEGLNVPVKTGKAVTFPGNQMEHGVNEVYGKARYVLTCWWARI